MGYVDYTLQTRQDIIHNVISPVQQELDDNEVIFAEIPMDDVVSIPDENIDDDNNNKQKNASPEQQITQEPKMDIVFNNNASRPNLEGDTNNKLDASIHSPKNRNIPNQTQSQQQIDCQQQLDIESHDLRNLINEKKLKNKSITQDQLKSNSDEKDHIFGFININDIPHRHRLHKIQYIDNYFKGMEGYVDIDWKQSNTNTYIIIEFTDHKNFFLATHKFNHEKAPASISLFQDSRQAIDNDKSQMSNMPQSQSTFILRQVHYTTTRQHIYRTLSYYGNITRIDDKYNQRFDNYRNVHVTFDSKNLKQEINNLWSVNIYGNCIRISDIRLNIQQLKDRNKFVAGFKGFHKKLTSSQAIRALKPFGGKTCYFHNNIAYIAFESKDAMDKAVQATILHQGYKIVGKYRNSSPQQTSLPNNSLNSQYYHDKAISLTSQKRPSLKRRNSTSNAHHTDEKQKQLKTTTSNINSNLKQNDNNNNSLAIILQKLNEMDTMKSLLTNLQTQFDTFQSTYKEGIIPSRS